MGDPNRIRAARFNGDSVNPPMQKSLLIQDEDLELRPTDMFYYSDAEVPCCEFSIFIGGEKAGTFYACLENDFEKVREVGNVSLELESKFNGKDLPYRAAKAVLPFFREQGIHSILITCNAGKRAVRAACDKLGARYLDTVETTSQSKQQDRFVLEF